MLARYAGRLLAVAGVPGGLRADALGSCAAQCCSAGATACSGANAVLLPPPVTAAGWRAASSSGRAGRSGSEATAGPSASSAQAPASQPPGQQRSPGAPADGDAAPSVLPPPLASQQAQELVDQLRKASPTGRLKDLFAQPGGDLPRSRRPRGGAPAAPAAAAPAAAAPEAAAAEPLTDRDVVAVVMRAVENCKPLMKVQQSKAGNRVVYTPVPLNPTQSRNFAIKWILQAAAKRREGAKGKSSLAECLALELLLAYQRKGTARARRDEVHKLALDNRANLRSRWA